MVRATDNDNIHWFRSDRFFTSDGMWFFTTRENANFGPYTRHPDAAEALRRYLDVQCDVEPMRECAREREPDEAFDRER